MHNRCGLSMSAHAEYVIDEARVRLPHLICAVNSKVQVRLLVQRGERDAAACQVRIIDTLSNCLSLWYKRGCGRHGHGGVKLSIFTHDTAAETEGTTSCV